MFYTENFSLLKLNLNQTPFCRFFLIIGKSTTSEFYPIFESNLNNMKSVKSQFFVFLALALLITSCLTAEKKEYTFLFTGINSGTLTIKYINIYASSIDSASQVTGDFNDLQSNYIAGEKIDLDYPGATKIKKRLFEENGQLCAEVTMDFPDLASARLYQYDKKSPIMFCVNTAFDTETYLESNGHYGGDYMPVVFFDGESKVLKITTKISEPDSLSVSLLNEWKRNK